MRLSLRTEIKSTSGRYDRSRYAALLLPFVAAVALSASLISCGPTLKPTLDVPSIKVSGAKIEKDSSAANTYLFVDDFVDGRVNKVFVRNNKKEISAAGNLAPAVADALKQALGARGFSFSESAPVIISGEVRDWNADVTGSLPTKVDAHAAIFIEILDPANKRIYSGVYKGFASIESASIGEKDVKRTLANSMEEAVTQVVADKQLVSVLSSY